MILFCLFQLPSTIYPIILIDASVLGLEACFLRYLWLNIGLPFVAPLTKGIVVIPAAMFATLWLLQYGLPSNVYYDEYSGDSREETRPTL